MRAVALIALCVAAAHGFHTAAPLGSQAATATSFSYPRCSPPATIRTGWPGLPRRPALPSVLREKAVDAAVPDPDRYKRALTSTALSVAAAGVFGASVWQLMGSSSGLEFFAGYVVEQSLSVDNLFVFVLLFDFFKVPLQYQNKVLTWGIAGAVVMRAVFIALGEAAMEVFQPVLLVFAAILIVSGYQLFVEEEEDEDLSENKIVQWSQSALKATDFYDEDNFFTVVDGLRRATPLLLVTICIELCDIVFAVDSIPAVFGVTKDPFIVYTSNIFAILNLRSLYTVLATAVGDLQYLRPAVAVVLSFVGCKLGGEYFGYEVSTGLSLAIITALLASGVGASLIAKPTGGEE
ncbi:unnamed protein product [Chrysoparadoxa australica]